MFFVPFSGKYHFCLPHAIRRHNRCMCARGAKHIDMPRKSCRGISGVRRLLQTTSALLNIFFGQETKITERNIDSLSVSTILPRFWDGELFSTCSCYSNLRILGIKPDDVGKMTRDEHCELDLLRFIFSFLRMSLSMVEEEFIVVASASTSKKLWQPLL